MPLKYQSCRTLQRIVVGPKTLSQATVKKMRHQKEWEKPSLARSNQ